MALAALSWCARRRVPAVMMSESTAWDTPRQPLKEWLKSRVVRRCASALVGGAPQLDYLAALGMPHERIFSGYDVVDNEHFALGASQARARGDELRKKLGLPERYLLASARFSPKKNLARLLDAYAGYLKQVFAEDPWHLVVLGDGAGREALLAQRAKLGLEKHIHLPGAKPYAELPVYYGLASAFIHASTTEQWGLVVNEAMASGLPVLVSQHCGCARDLVRNEMNGFTFDPYSTEDITEKILRLFRSPDCVATFGRASQEVMARWSPTRFAQGLSAAIEIALSSPTRSSPLDRIFLSILARYSGGNAATN
jgi:1,2-diacylglycerol 3-alpha-glucosyltransferase